MDVTKAQLQASIVNEDGGDGINCIRCTPEHCISTDGGSLIIIPHFTIQPGESDIMIPPEAAKRLAKAMGRDDTVRISQGPKRTECVMETDDGPYTAGFESPARKFPKWKALLPDHSKAKTIKAFRVSTLKKIINSLGKVGADTFKMWITPDGIYFEGLSGSHIKAMGVLPVVEA